MFKLAIKKSDSFFPLLRMPNTSLLYPSMRLLSVFPSVMSILCPSPHHPEGFSHSWTSIMFALLSSEHLDKRTHSLDRFFFPPCRLRVDFCNENRLRSPCTTSEHPQSAQVSFSPKELFSERCYRFTHFFFFCSDFPVTCSLSRCAHTGVLLTQICQMEHLKRTLLLEFDLPKEAGKTNPASLSPREE